MSYRLYFLVSQQRASCREYPDLKLAALIKRHETRVQYFQGSVTKNKDLDRVKVRFNVILKVFWGLSHVLMF